MSGNGSGYSSNKTDYKLIITKVVDKYMGVHYTFIYLCIMFEIFYNQKTFLRGEKKEWINK